MLVSAEGRHRLTHSTRNEHCQKPLATNICEVEWPICFNNNGGLNNLCLQVKRAEERGAKAVVLYSDPADYNVANTTTVYPDSWWIPPPAASRGSILRGTGDPLTPG